LIIFGGLPGVGKTALAKAVAREWEAVYLRADTIEQALRFSETLQGEVGPAGYIVAYRLAEENLRIGRTVVADSVNPLNTTRDAWLSVAADASKDAIEIEVICSDPSEHRRRVETRNADIDGLSWPTLASRSRKKPMAFSVFLWVAVGINSTRLASDPPTSGMALSSAYNETSIVIPFAFVDGDVGLDFEFVIDFVAHFTGSILQ